MSHEKPVDMIDYERRYLCMATCAVAGVGAIAAAGALISTFQPSERAKAAGAPVEVDISSLGVGGKKVVEWRGKPVWIMKRTSEQMDTLSKVSDELADPESLKPYMMDMPQYCKNPRNTRSRTEYEEVLVLVGICPHLGCSPVDKFVLGPQPSLPNDWKGGFLCPCHGSTFDIAGRVFKNKPSPNNLDVPRHMYLSSTKLVIGKDEKGEV